MNTMIKLYESIAEETSPKELKKRLDAGSIFYYDAQSTAGVSTFDKRSPEGKALISAKRIVQREKLLAQRGYSINTKLKDLNVGMSNMEVKDN
ncbi:hypothetical protein GGI24_003932 [Coemansia furcata]|nr:hypothetical protein GGI24_003932 [Coemansia furcata]